MVIYESEADARDKHIWLEETFAWKWLWRRMRVGEVRDRGYEMGEELDGDDVGAELGNGAPTSTSTGGRGGSGSEEVGREEEGQFTIADEYEDDSDDDEDENGDISGGGGGGGDEGARAFKAVVENPPKSASPPPVSNEVDEDIQDPLQSNTNNDDGEVRPDQEGEEEEEESIPCLIDRLFSCTIDLLFCAGFTVPESVRGIDGDKINVGAPVLRSPPPSPVFLFFSIRLADIPSYPSPSSHASQREDGQCMNSSG